MKPRLLFYSRFFLFCITSLFYFSKVFSQDSLFTKEGKTIAVKVLEIDKELIKYKKYSNVEGPTYNIEKNNVLRIKYQNGEVENIEADNTVIAPKENKTSIPLTTYNDPTKKGNKVFIECKDDELINLKNELKNEINLWNYWHIVYTREEADFILEVSTTKRAMDVVSSTKVTSKATTKLLDGKILWESNEFSSKASIANGWNPLHASIKKLINDGLKKKYN